MGYPGDLYEDQGSCAPYPAELYQPPPRDAAYPTALYTEGSRDVYPVGLYPVKKGPSKVLRWRSVAIGLGLRKTAKLRVFDRSKDSAVATIQRFYRQHQARITQADENTWAMFKALDGAHEWHTVHRMERMKTLRAELLHLMAGKMAGTESLATPVHAPRALPCPSNESIRLMIAGMAEGRSLPITDAISIVEAAIMVFAAENTVVHISDEGGRIVVVGDLHGNLHDLLYILRECGLPGPGNKYVFNGDLVDRGENSCEVLLLVYALKLSTPEAVHINRGNHEDREVNVFYGFVEECRIKYDHRFYELCSNSFDWMPYACVLNSTVLVLHGGLTSVPDFDILELASLQRGPEMLHNRTPREAKILSDIKWSDPHRDERFTGLCTSTRGRGVMFGWDVTHNFLDRCKLTLLVRSHEEQRSGYRMQHHGRLHTIFSASNYVGHGNGAAVLIFNPGKPHPQVMTWSYKAAARLCKHSQPFKAARREEGMQLMIDHLRDYVVQNEHSLLEYFTSVDTSNGKSPGTGTVSEADWAKGLQLVLRLDEVPRAVRVQLLAGMDCVQGDQVDFKKYLQQTRENYFSHFRMTGGLARWHKDAVLQLAQHLSRSAVDFEKAFAMFDTDGSGDLSFTEFCTAMRKVVSLEVLSDFQLQSLASAFDTNADNRISKSEFISMLTSVDESDWLPVEWAEDRRKERIRRLREEVRHRSLGNSKVREILRKYDADKDGRLDRDEFRLALHHMGIAFDEYLFNDLIESIGSPSEPKEQAFPTHSMNSPYFPVERVDLVGNEVKRLSCVSSYRVFLIRVTPAVGDPWEVSHRYTVFEHLRNRLGYSDGFPEKLLVNTSSAIDSRQKRLEEWLQHVVDKAHMSSPEFRPALRMFLRVPAGAGPVRRPQGTLPLKILAEALAPRSKGSVTSVGVAPAVSNALLRIISLYRKELLHLFSICDSGGGVTTDEFRLIIATLNELEGFPLTRSQVDALVHSVDRNNDGRVDVSEIEEAVASPLAREESVDYLNTSTCSSESGQASSTPESPWRLGNVPPSPFQPRRAAA